MGVSIVLAKRLSNLCFDIDHFLGDCEERGASLIELLVSLAVGSLILIGVFYFFQSAFRVGERFSQLLELSQSLTQVELSLRRDLNKLYFTPHCTGVLPLKSQLIVDDSVSPQEVSFLQRGVTIHRSTNREESLAIDGLKTEGGARYTPQLPKNISRLIVGSDVVTLSGVVPIGAQLAGADLYGEFPRELEGRRQQLFLITNCQKSWLMKGNRVGDRFRLPARGMAEMERKILDPASALARGQLQVYAVLEKLFYLQKIEGSSYFVQDNLDAQAFVRIPRIVSLRAELSEDGRFLGISSVAAHAGRGRYQTSKMALGDFISERLQLVRAGAFQEALWLIPLED